MTLTSPDTSSKKKPRKQLAPASTAPAQPQAALGCWQLYVCPTWDLGPSTATGRLEGNLGGEQADKQPDRTGEAGDLLRSPS